MNSLGEEFTVGICEENSFLKNWQIVSETKILRESLAIITDLFCCQKSIFQLTDF